MFQMKPNNKDKKIIKESLKNIERFFSGPKDFETSAKSLTRNLGDINLVIIGTILNYFGYLYKEEELAEIIAKDTGFSELYVLETIKKSRDLAFKNNIAT